jgi:methyl-accepting chemotaxis protein
MVDRNAESARQSQMDSVRGKEQAEKGKVTIGNMIHSMENISTSNDRIVDEIGSNNKEMQGIIGIINEIADKTKVINDIVFQTKLLSFNASVEAARAGEHGKGFAVVAEEIGNLARVSGEAADQINTILVSGKNKVDEIVRGSEARTSSILTEGKKKIESGFEVAESCKVALDSIVTSVTSINERINEISNATVEQAKGTQEISTAIEQLDKSAQGNAAVSNQSAATAAELKKRSQILMQIVHDLNHLITGALQSRLDFSGEKKEAVQSASFEEKHRAAA